MTDGLEDWMGKPVYDGLAERQELRDARAEDLEHALEEARADALAAVTRLRRTEVLHYRYGKASTTQLQQAKQAALSARARVADLEEGS